MPPAGSFARLLHLSKKWSVRCCRNFEGLQVVPELLGTATESVCDVAQGALPGAGAAPPCGDAGLLPGLLSSVL
mgnify:FL=1